MDPKVLNNRPNHKTRTKPNLIGMGNTLKGKGNNKWIHKPNTLALPTPNAERKLWPKPINHSQSQPNPLPLTQPLTHPKNTSSPTQSPTKEVPKTMNTSDTVPMDHLDQAKHNPDNGKPMHASMGPDIAISKQEGSRSVVTMNHELPISVEEVGLQINLGSRPLSGILPKDMALGQLEGGHGGSRPSIKDFIGDLESTWDNFNNWVLELRDGKQIVIPLSLHHSLGSILDFSKHERDEG